jgi:hypothetical protein
MECICDLLQRVQANFKQIARTEAPQCKQVKASPHHKALAVHALKTTHLTTLSEQLASCTLRAC